MLEITTGVSSAAVGCVWRREYLGSQLGICEHPVSDDVSLQKIGPELLEDVFDDGGQKLL